MQGRQHFCLYDEDKNSLMEQECLQGECAASHAARRHTHGAAQCMAPLPCSFAVSSPALPLAAMAMTMAPPTQWRHVALSVPAHCLRVCRPSERSLL